MLSGFRVATTLPFRALERRLVAIQSPAISHTTAFLLYMIPCMAIGVSFTRHIQRHGGPQTLRKSNVT
jgi:hypothetical protein